MIFIIGFCIIVTVAAIAIFRSQKPVKEILSEAKYEIIFSFLGSQGVFQDIVMRSKNKTELINKSDKIAIITGGTRGIGLEVVKMLLKCDMKIIMGCRNVSYAKALLTKIREKDGITTGTIEPFQLDISSIKSIETFAKEIRQNFNKIHYLINCAGIMVSPYLETQDGYESLFSTNYLGHFYLTHLLLDLLKEGGTDDKTSASRIVNVTSIAHIAGNINFEDINNKKGYLSQIAYSQAKLAQILFSNHLNELLKNDNVKVYSVHPGIVNTDIFDGSKMKRFIPWAPNIFFKSPEAGAIPIVHTCLSPQLEDKGGAYIHNCVVVDTCEKAKDTEQIGRAHV